MVVMPEKMHQRTSEQKQIWRGGERVARMCRQQVNPKRRCDKRDSQPKPGTDKMSECVHRDSHHHQVGMTNSQYRAAIRSL
jgi:hypothetical protein